MNLYVPIWLLWLFGAIVCFIAMRKAFRHGSRNTMLGPYFDPFAMFIAGVACLAGCFALFQAAQSGLF